jgi:hypothetical protein
MDLAPGVSAFTILVYLSESLKTYSSGNHFSFCFVFNFLVGEVAKVVECLLGKHEALLQYHQKYSH